MIEVVNVINAVKPGAALHLAELALTGSLVEKTGVCYQKWRTADQSHGLFVEPNTDLGTSTLVQRAQQQFSMIKRTHGVRRSLDGDQLYQCPPVVGVWFASLDHAQQHSLVEPILAAFPTPHPLVRAVAPFLKLPQITQRLELIVRSRKHNKEAYSWSDLLAAEHGALRMVSMMLNHHPQLLSSSPLEELQTCRMALSDHQQSVGPQLKNGMLLWEEFTAQLDRALMQSQLQSPAASAPKRRL